jgi:Domain of unknown function (DUF4389)
MTTTAGPTRSAGPFTPASPVRVTGRIDASLSRWLWLVKWLLALPHLIVLAFLWAGFVVLSVVAFVAILVTGRYPRSIFAYTVGVLRWSWRVTFYAAGAFGTDRYPPFTLGPVPGYPATLDVVYPEHLSRGLVLVKWWLLAIPHYLVVAVFAGGGTWSASRTGTASGVTWPLSGGLIGLLAIIAGVILLVTGRYPRSLFDLLVGLHRWVLRVVAYAGLLTDVYPPFRLDMGGDEPDAGDGPTGVPVTAQRVSGGEPPDHVSWTAGRIVAAVLGSMLLFGALGAGAGGTAAFLADTAGRDAAGFLTSATARTTTAGYALVTDPFDLRVDPGTTTDLHAVLGDVRVRASGPVPVFVGIGPADAVARYVGDVDRDRMTGMGPGGQPARTRVTGGAPAGPPATRTFWSASATGTGPQELRWPAQAGSWTAVVMNADGSRPVAVDLSMGVTAPGLPVLWGVLFTLAALGLLVGIVLVLVAVSAGSSRPPDPGPSPLPGHPDAS